MQQAVPEPWATLQPPRPSGVPLTRQRAEPVSEGWHGSPELCTHRFTYPGITAEAWGGERKAWEEAEVTST